MICARCNKTIKNDNTHFAFGYPFGPECINKINQFRRTAGGLKITNLEAFYSLDMLREDVLNAAAQILVDEQCQKFEGQARKFFDESLDLIQAEPAAFWAEAIASGLSPRGIWNKFHHDRKLESNEEYRRNFLEQNDEE